MKCLNKQVLKFFSSNHLSKKKKNKFLFKSILMRHELVIEVWEDAGLI